MKKKIDYNDFCIDDVFKRFEEKRGSGKNVKSKKHKGNKKPEYDAVREVALASIRKQEEEAYQESLYKNDPTGRLLNDPDELSILLNGIVRVNYPIHVVIPV